MSTGAAVGGFVGRHIARRLDAYGRMVTVCLRSRRRGLQRTRSGRTPLQLGQHRQPPPSRRATAAGIPSMAVWYALGARRTSTPRHVGHWATTRQSRTRCQTGDLRGNAAVK